MLNKEKFEEEIANVIAVDKKTMKIRSCRSIECNDCLFNTEDCTISSIKWMNEEYIQPLLKNGDDLKINDMIYVSNDEKHWHKAHFSHYKNGQFYTFIHGTTSWTNDVTYGNVMDSWTYAKLP